MALEGIKPTVKTEISHFKFIQSIPCCNYLAADNFFVMLVRATRDNTLLINLYHIFDISVISLSQPQWAFRSLGRLWGPPDVLKCFLRLPPKIQLSLLGDISEFHMAFVMRLLSWSPVQICHYKQIEYELLVPLLKNEKHTHSPSSKCWTADQPNAPLMIKEVRCIEQP